MAEFVDEYGVVHDDPVTTKQENASKASFKLNLIETVNADPVMKASDVKLIAAYAAVLQWPEREAWLSTSRARAMTGLSDRQVRASRARLAGKNSAKRTYLHMLRKHGSTSIFRVDNPWWEDSRQYVAVTLDYYRGLERAKKSLSRQNLQGRKRCCPGRKFGDVPANNAANIPTIPPQDISLEREGTMGSVFENEYAKASGGY